MSSPRPPDLLVVTALLGLTVVLLAHAYIDLQVAVDLPLPGGGTWQANAPVADVAGLLLFPLALLAGARASGVTRGRPARRAARLALPGAVGWGLFLVASLLSVQHAADPAGALHHLVRKPLLVYLIYGVGLAWLVATVVPRRALPVLVLGALGLTSLVSLSTSVGRILAGDTLWFASLAGLTPNHKTLAVCLAGWLPLVISWCAPTPAPDSGPRQHLAARITLALCLAAIAASLSKTAWLGTGLAVACFLPLARPLAWRPRLLVPTLVLGVALAYYSPVLLRSRTMLDAARSRHSLNIRAWHMFRAHPLVGSGTGTSPEVELVTFPHYRVNGVDAHGAVQKVASEAGLLGLAGFGLFVLGSGRGLVLRWREERALLPAAAATALPTYGALATFAVLHGQLLLSTELFSPTHWVPLATAWGISRAQAGGKA